MKNIAFIINPIAGTQTVKKKLPKLINATLDRAKWLPNIVFSEYAGHATELARQFSRMGFEAVVAVGGDGTINEVARGLVGTATTMGIIPLGSGNGLARHLNLPLRPQTAIELLNHAEPIAIDYGLANDRLFVSTCGAGFEAHVAYEFAAAGTRGFRTYFEQIIKDAFSYQPETYTIRLVEDGKEITHKAFLITFANSNQWGYEARIAPKASLQDGLMDICIMSPHALLGSADLALRLFTKHINESLFMDTIKAGDVVLVREQPGLFHIDGDPVEMPKEIHIRIIEDGLRVLVGKRF